MKCSENNERAVKAICEVMESKGYSTEIRANEILGTRGQETVSFSPELLLDLCSDDLSYDGMTTEMILAIEFLPVMNLDRIKPYLITDDERIALDEGIYVETIEDGRHIIYHDDLVRRTQPFVTKKEVHELANIRKMAFKNLEVVERFDYSLNGIEGVNASRIIDEDRSIDPRIALLTKNVSQIIIENYQNHTYLVTTPRGDLFVFGIDEDPSQVVGVLMDTSIGLLSKRFDVLTYHKKQIDSHLTIISERKCS